MSDRFSGTEEVSAALAFDADALLAWAKENNLPLEGPLTIRQFRGGQSNPTYFIEDRAGARYVLRRKPPGKILKSAHAVEREARVMRALEQTDVPVPHVLALEEDPDVIGTAFFMMEYLDGLIFWDTRLKSVAREERGEIMRETARGLARLHSVDPDEAGLSDYGKAGNYFERQIRRWAGQYTADREDAGKIETMEKLIAWLPGNIPEGDETCIVHGDYRLDNLVYAKDRPELIGILDWELSTLGHPLADLSYACLPYRFPQGTFGGLAGVDIREEGLIPEAEFVETYAAATGRSTIPNLDFHMAFNMFRLAAILHGIVGRTKRGTAKSSRAYGRDAARGMAALAWEQAKRAGASKA